MQKMAWDGPKWGQEDFFPTNPDLADILSRTDLNFEIFYSVLIFWTPNFCIFRSPGLQISNFKAPRSPNSQIPRFPGSQISRRRRRRRQRRRRCRCQNEFSDPNLTPLPTHPGIKYVARTLAANYLGIHSQQTSQVIVRC